MLKKTRVAAAIAAVMAQSAVAHATTTLKAFAYDCAVELNDRLFGLMVKTGGVQCINDFNKEEVVAFENLLEGFQDALIMSDHVSIYRGPDTTQMERADDIFWRPMPVIARSFDGQDQTGNFQQFTGLAVPATIGFEKSVPWYMSATELRDALAEGRLGKAAKQRISSDVNVSLMNIATAYGSCVVKRSGAASGFDDLALADAVFNEIGVDTDERVAAFSSRDNNSMASNLAGRQTMAGKPTGAYERAFVGNVCGFDTFKLDYAKRITVAAGSGITMSTLVAGANFYTPVAKRTAAATGERSNVDNRFQRITVNSTTGIVAGDCFTVPTALNAVHLITKLDTGQPKTFRVISVDSSTTMTITPPMITAQGATDAEKQYQNCTILTAASNSALVWQNTAAAAINPFWHRDAIELIPSRYAVPPDAGMSVMHAQTDQGFELLFSKQASIDNLKTKYRVDARWGTVNKNTEMSGILLFNQP